MARNKAFEFTVKSDGVWLEAILEPRDYCDGIVVDEHPAGGATVGVPEGAPLDGVAGCAGGGALLVLDHINIAQRSWVNEFRDTAWQGEGRGAGFVGDMDEDPVHVPHRQDPFEVESCLCGFANQLGRGKGNWVRCHEGQEQASCNQGGVSEHGADAHRTWQYRKGSG